MVIKETRAPAFYDEINIGGGPDLRQMGNDARDSPPFTLPLSLPLIALLSSWLPAGSHKPLSLPLCSVVPSAPFRPSTSSTLFVYYICPFRHNRVSFVVVVADAFFKLSSEFSISDFRPLPLLPASPSSRQRQAFVQAQWASAGVSLAARKGGGANDIPPSTTSAATSAAASQEREKVREGRRRQTR